MSAILDPKPGDTVQTPDGRLRIVQRTDRFQQAGDIWYTTSRQTGAKVHNCWITTWRDWCKRTLAVEVEK